MSSATEFLVLAIAAALVVVCETRARRCAIIACVLTLGIAGYGRTAVVLAVVLVASVCWIAVVIRADRRAPLSTEPPPLGRDRLMRAFLAVTMISLVVFSRAYADHGTTRAPDGHPLIPAVRVSTPPMIDGRLDDLVWLIAPMLDDFYSPRLDRTPPESTVVRLACDSAFLYIAARCYDREPALIRRDQTRRGGSFAGDDYLAVSIDAHHEHRSGGSWQFTVNARGTQDETIPAGAASKIEWRGDWTAAALVDTLGWTAEMEIPLDVFGLPAGERTVGISLWRRIGRTDERFRWPNTGTRIDEAKDGDWTGIRFPHRTRRPAFMPYVVGEATRDDPDGTVGIDAKYTIRRGLVVAGTINPDFRNVERQILAIDHSYSEKSVAENRPFFVDGKSYLPGSDKFYTRRVGEMYGGLKIYGTAGEHRIGFLDAYGRDRVNHATGEWMWQSRPRAELTNQFSWRHGPEEIRPRADVPLGEDHLTWFGQARRGWARERKDDWLYVNGGFTRTASDSGNGHQVGIYFDRYARPGALTVQAYVMERSRGYLPADGLLSKTDTDVRQGALFASWVHEYDRPWMREWYVKGLVRRGIRFDGDLYLQIYSVGGGADIRRGLNVYGELVDYERPPYHDRVLHSSVGWNADRLYGDGSVYSQIGKIAGTDYLYVAAEQSVRLAEPLSMSVEAQYARRDYPIGHVDRPADGVVESWQAWATATFDLTIERAISGRIARTSGGTNGYASYRQTVRRGMDLFLILGAPSADSWTGRVALKAMVVL